MGTAVLLVENEEGLAEFLKEGLECGDFSVVLATEGDRALEIVRDQRIDIVVTDIFLPGMNGIELLKRIKERAPRTEVIAIARGAPVQTVVTAIKEGAFDYMEKPIDPDHMRLVVEKAVEKTRLSMQNIALRRMATKGVPRRMVCTSPAMQEVTKTVDLVAPTDLTVLVEGESGVGKELVANLIHERSDRSEMPFIAINCGVLQESLLESELFGHEKGSFTGAIADHAGLFEVADGGTIFLDEVGEMSQDLQVKLLRVLETNEFRRVGGHKVIRVDVRVIAATNKRLEDEVRGGRFREDLYYRLNVIRVEVPPLRRRTEEIPDLVASFVERNRLRGIRSKRFTPEAVEALKRYPWPGNVRELENLVERTLILARTDVITPQDLPDFLSQRPAGGATAAGAAPVVEEEDVPLAEMERRAIIRALARNKGNKVQTARRLGINVKTLYNKIKAYHIDQERPIETQAS